MASLASSSSSKADSKCDNNTTISKQIRIEAKFKDEPELRILDSSLQKKLFAYRDLNISERTLNAVFFGSETSVKNPDPKCNKILMIRI